MILHVVSGLPRAGSTLLCNVLMQNPRFYASQTSGLVELVLMVRNQWDKLVEMQAMEKGLGERRKLQVMRGVVESYYADVVHAEERMQNGNDSILQGSDRLPRSREVVFDKSRGWLAHLETLEAVLGRRPKVLAPVRDLRDVLASFEKLHRTQAATKQAGGEQNGNYLKFQTVEQRLAHWVNYDQVVGLAYNRIKDALARGWRNDIYFVAYERFTENPGKVMREIYEFLEEPFYEHDFKNVEQVTWEDDTVHGYGEGALHTIRREIRPQEAQWPKVLGKEAELYRGQELW